MTTPEKEVTKTDTPIEDDQFVFGLVDEHDVEGLTIGSVSFDSSAEVILSDSGEVAGIVSCSQLA